MSENNEDLRQPAGGPEPHVTFRLESDRGCWEIRNPEVDEPLVQITGYDLRCQFNTKYLRSVEEIEAACNGIHGLFRELIMEQLLGKDKLGS